MIPRLKIQPKLNKVRPAIALCLVQICLFFGLGISNFSGTTASANPLALTTEFYPVAQTSSQPLDLEEGSNKADEASQTIFEGIDTTKDWIGNREETNQAIEKARESASDKWKSLADKARNSENSDESLSPPEGNVLKRLTSDN
ncbi:MAG TPA: hypothetical protein DCL61_26675 [Cyanobacteria bacterium UBA12227]|nr:hypothetical protein [Cyanobacteria bacterium UBA12227]HAX87116.1 hypothetical protein [Cyanobacteria bacterium UBA11370]HBY80316.1 hypothetical protein [Cyanobacteria bacterium UBA11148]